jgi:hypothetical protein
VLLLNCDGQPSFQKSVMAKVIAAVRLTYKHTKKLTRPWLLDCWINYCRRAIISGLLKYSTSVVVEAPLK